VTTSNNANRQLARAAGTVMAAMLFGKLIGLVSSVLIADTFPSAQLGAFFSANRVSETLFSLIAAGALGSAFLPTFTSLLVRNERSSAWRLASSFLNLVTLVSTIAALLASLFAPQIVRYFLAPGFSSDPALFSLTVNLLRIQSVSVVLFGIGGLIISILNAHQIFFIPQLTASMYQIGQIFGVLVLARWMGIYGLAWGVVIGSALFVLIQVPSLLRLRGEYNSSLGLKNPDVTHVFRLMVPRVFGAAIVQLNFWVNNNLASRMAEKGSILALTEAFTVMTMALAIIAQSVAIAAMPTFSAQHALGKVDEMRSSLASALRGLFLLTIPASVGLILLAKPIISMLFERGEFTATMTEITAWVLVWFAAGLVGHSIMEVLTRAYYAQQDTKTPVIIGAAAMGLNIIFSILFSWWFGLLGWYPVAGLALANSLATALEAAALFIVMRRRLHGIYGSSLLNGFLRCAAAALGMGLVLWLWVQGTAGMSSWVVALGGVILGGLVYLVAVLLLRVPEAQMIARIVIGRLRRSPY
jgi:putative peptidoglycan lipid II flippase